MTITLLNVDCMEYMAGLPDKAFDLAIVDPPYGIDVANSNFGARKFKNKSCDGKEWDRYTPRQDYFEQLRRVSKDQIIWGGPITSTVSQMGWGQLFGINKTQCQPALNAR